MSIRYRSDVIAGMAQEVLAALAEANEGDALPFGQDPVTKCLTDRVAEVFEHEAWVFPVSTGTAANVIALSAIVPPGRGVLCHVDSHIFDSESGAVEFYTYGARLVPLPAENGKLSLPALRDLLSGTNPRGLGVPPAVLSLTQLTEWGSAYRPDEIRALADVAHTHKLLVHMDGARLANALASLGCAPAETTWRAGIDVLCLGGTKNGTLAADAVVAFDAETAARVAERVRRGGHRVAKMRLMAVQLDALLANGLWLRNAGHANEMARRLGHGLGELPGARLMRPIEGNQIFIHIPAGITDRLKRRDIDLWLWHRDTEGAPVYRIVTSFKTPAEEIDEILAIARS